MTRNMRWHRGFDQVSKRVYPYLLSYSSEEEAREDIPGLAKRLGISKQAVGAYIGQARRHPGIHRLLTKMGYADTQIPQWVKRPKYQAAIPPQPQAAPVEAKPPVSTQVQAPANSHPPDLSSKKLEGEEYANWWWHQSPSVLREFDINRLPPDSYRLAILRAGDEAKPKQVTRGREVEQQRPKEPTPEEKKAEEERKKRSREDEDLFNKIIQFKIINQAADSISADLEEREQIRWMKEDFPKQVKEAVASLHKQPPPPSPQDKVQSTAKAITTPIKPLITPEDMKAIQSAAEQRDREELQLKFGLAKMMIDSRRKGHEERMAKIYAMSQLFNTDKRLAETPIRRPQATSRRDHLTDFLNNLNDALKQWTKENSQR